MDGELKFNLVNGVVLRLLVRDDKNSVRLSLMSESKDGTRSFTYAFATGCITPRDGFLDLDRRVRLSFTEGDDTFEIWIGSASFDLPPEHLQAVRDALPGVEVTSYERLPGAGLVRKSSGGAG